MGRTLPPFSQLIEYERRAWAPFRRALRKDDQATFDRLFDCAKLHVQAGVYLSRPWPFEVLAMAMLLEHHKRLEHLFAQLEALCHSVRPAISPALERPPASPTPTGTVERLPVPLEEGQGEGPYQGTLPYPTPLQAGAGGQTVEDGTQR
ncbi:MAG TPA: hypothetical protein VLK82_27745 [Candidatus Tectomicrobia bacterium]|nr:hypothetical protein [Candidatus Tectomicrobia bacterium]